MNTKNLFKRRSVYHGLATLCLAFVISNSYGQEGPDASLKETFKDDFLIGTAPNGRQLSGSNEAEQRLITSQYNALTPENLMKSQSLQPEWGRYEFDQADRFIAYASEHNMKVNAHTLIWHSQLPRFMRHMEDADSVRQFFEGHIKTVAGRYDGKVDSWDVVNEALNEDGTLRNSVFLRALGDDYIVEAFKLAQEASPQSKLYYNDYNIEQPKKRAGALRIVKKIQEAGVRIDGVGIQGHWHLGRVPMGYIEQTIQAFAALGVDVMFTELDISVLPNAAGGNTAEISRTSGYSERLNPYPDGLPDSVQQALAQDYENLFRLFLTYRDNVSRVTFWGAHDGQTWLNNWPIRGRTNYPLLFDRNLAPKPAFYQVIATKSNE